MLNLHKNPEHGHHGHPAHGHPPHPAPLRPPHPPHGHPLHDRHGHPPHPGHSHQGAAATLEKIVPHQDVISLTRAMRVCPPEMRAEFLILMAIIEHQLQLCEAIGSLPPHFDLFDPAEEEANQRALSITLPESEQQACLQDLMRGPPEVQAVAYVSLIALRLADIASASAMIDEVENDG